MRASSSRLELSTGLFLEVKWRQNYKPQPGWWSLLLMFAVNLPLLAVLFAGAETVNSLRVSNEVCTPGRQRQQPIVFNLCRFIAPFDD